MTNPRPDPDFAETERERAIAEAWRAYSRSGDRRPLERLGILTPRGDEPPQQP